MTNLKWFLVGIAIFVTSPIWFVVGWFLLMAFLYLSVIGFAVGALVGVFMLIHALVSGDA